MSAALSVSVAMATYNGERHIRQQLESLAAQTNLPAEIVITDDGSVDDTLNVVDAFSKTAAFQISVHRNESRLGYRGNFIKAASLCSSDLIAFCDQDDYWYPHKIAESVKPFSDPDVLLTYHDADVMRDGIRFNSLADRAPRRPVLAPLSSGPWWPYALGFTEVFRRSLLPLSHLWPKSLDQQTYEGEPLAHDQWVFFLASVFGKIAYVDEPLVAWVQHGRNTVGWGHDDFSVWVKSRFHDRSDESRHLSKAASARAQILESAKDSLEGAWAERAATGAAYYRTVSSIYDRRRALYASPTFSERLRAFGAIVGMNGYSGAWGPRPRSLVADMCVGVLSIGSLARSISG